MNLTQAKECSSHLLIITGIRQLQSRLEPTERLRRMAQPLFRLSKLNHGPSLPGDITRRLPTGKGIPVKLQGSRSIRGGAEPEAPPLPQQLLRCDAVVVSGCRRPQFHQLDAVTPSRRLRIGRGRGNGHEVGSRHWGYHRQPLAEGRSRIVYGVAAGSVGSGKLNGHDRLGLFHGQLQVRPALNPQLRDVLPPRSDLVLDRDASNENGSLGGHRRSRTSRHGRGGAGGR